MSLPTPIAVSLWSLSMMRLGLQWWTGQPEPAAPPRDARGRFVKRG